MLDNHTGSRRIIIVTGAADMRKGIVTKQVLNTRRTSQVRFTKSYLTIPVACDTILTV